MFVSGATGARDSGAAGAPAPSQPSASAAVLRPRVSAPERCPDDRRGTRFYRTRYAEHRELRGAATPYPVGRKPINCSDARQLARVWKGKALVARRFTERWQKRLRFDVSLAINFVFGPYAGQAHRVVSCESGHSTTARNGQQLGLFQMGSSERARYGHGDSPLEQARAAYRYFVASGKDWSPWQCQP